MRFYILCKNEIANIRKCIEALVRAGAEVTVLDSGSSDGTIEAAREYPVTIENYRYTTHCDAYNDVTTRSAGEKCGIVDADMEVTPELVAEIESGLKGAEVVICPIRMYVDAHPLIWGSLCPPKPVGFRSGRPYFEPVGHGERLLADSSTTITSEFLGHNDLKPYSAYLSSQVRYSDNFVSRIGKGQASSRDWLRFHTPLMMLITPLYSLFLKGGIFSRTGWLYAIDRMVAEALMFRGSVLNKLNASSACGRNEGLTK